MNLALFKREIKSNYKVFIIIFSVLLMYTSVVTSLFDPNLGSILEQFSQTMPELMSAFGMTSPGSTLIEFLSSYLYGFIYLVFPLIFEIIVANKLVARYVDRGSMAYLLSTPVSRKTIIMTQISVLWITLAALICLMTLAQIIVSHLMFPGDLDVSRLIYMNIGLYCLHLAISGICFFGSCISNEMKNSYLIGAGIPILFILIQMLSNISDKLDSLKYVTLLTLFPAQEIASHETNGLFQAGILLLIATLLYSLGAYLFTKRDLPL